MCLVALFGVRDTFGRVIPSPEGADYASPGQSPGFMDAQDIEALKGRAK